MADKGESGPTAAHREDGRDAPRSEEEEEEEIIDDEFLRLARSLATLGLFDEAQRCQAHAAVVSRLSAAEEKKREAVAKEDFEGAIKMKETIQALTAETAPSGLIESWRQAVALGQRDKSFDVATERLRQQCQFLDSDALRQALTVAVDHFHDACPNPQRTRGAGGTRNLLKDLPELVLQKRRARQMSRSIEAVSSSNILHFLQALFVCLGTLGELIGACAKQLHVLASPDWTREEREAVARADEFKGLCRGLASLRRILWRFDLAGQLFLPRGGADTAAADAGDSSAEELATLRKLHAGARSNLSEAKAAWDQVEAALKALRLDLAPWDPSKHFEAGDGSGAEDRHRSAPLCVLCLLPAVPLGLDTGAPVEEGVSSHIWKNGTWHVQCANFWTRHCAPAKCFKEFGATHPFA
mmetsp:Transcript_94093/g.266221  ORF Transcript_94093/g.266221 Transcript_94093/m.266221 type:complete len:413 (-) Transcript_94093:111-1349(-)